MGSVRTDQEIYSAFRSNDESSLFDLEQDLGELASAMKCDRTGISTAPGTFRRDVPGKIEAHHIKTLAHVVDIKRRQYDETHAQAGIRERELKMLQIEMNAVERIGRGVPAFAPEEEILPEVRPSTAGNLPNIPSLGGTPSFVKLSREEGLMDTTLTSNSKKLWEIALKVDEVESRHRTLSILDTTCKHILRRLLQDKKSHPRLQSERTQQLMEASADCDGMEQEAQRATQAQKSSEAGVEQQRKRVVIQRERWQARMEERGRLLEVKEGLEAREEEFKASQRKFKFDVLGDTDVEAEKAMQKKHKMQKMERMHNSHHHGKAEEELRKAETMFARIKAATGMTDVKEITEKLIHPSNMPALAAAAKERHDGLVAQMAKCHHDLQDIRFIGAHSQSHRKVLDATEERLAEAEAVTAEAVQRFKKVDEELVHLKLGIHSIADQLSAIKLTEPPPPAPPPPDPDMEPLPELEVLFICEAKEVRLLEFLNIYVPAVLHGGPSTEKVAETIGRRVETSFQERSHGFILSPSSSRAQTPDPAVGQPAARGVLSRRPSIADSEQSFASGSSVPDEERAARKAEEERLRKKRFQWSKDGRPPRMAVLKTHEDIIQRQDIKSMSEVPQKQKSAEKLETTKPDVPPPAPVSPGKAAGRAKKQGRGSKAK